MDLRRIKNDIPKEITEYAQAKAENTRSQFASYIVYRYGEIVERVFAFRRYKCGEKQSIKITEVVRHDTSGKSRTITKNLVFTYMGGYAPQFEAKNRYTRNGWGYRTFNKEWFDIWYDVYDSFIPPTRHVVNGDILKGIEEFKYCSYRSGDVIAYLKAYRKHKGVEFIGKLDLPLSKALINKCERDKAFRTFLYKNHEAVRPIGVRVFIYAYDHHLPFERAQTEMRAARNKNLEKNFARATARAKALVFSDERLTIFPAEKPIDLITEGNALSHCVGSARMGYDKKHAKGESVILFVRRISEKDKPYVTVEYDPKGKRILQKYGAHNSKPENDVQKFLCQWLKAVENVACYA